jgi:hypothetical protein
MVAVAVVRLGQTALLVEQAESEAVVQAGPLLMEPQGKLILAEAEEVRILAAVQVLAAEVAEV